MISVTGNFLCEFRSKKSSSVKKPATEISSHLDALKSSFDINLKSGKLSFELFFGPRVRVCSWVQEDYLGDELPG